MSLANLGLVRIPSSPALQAWNAADELALERLAKRDLGRLLIVNDAFGALSLGLNEPSTDWWYDSAMAYQALQLNSSRLGRPLPRCITDPDSLGNHYQTVVIQTPKSLALFDWQLSEIVSRLAPDALVVTLGMVKHLSAGHQSIMKGWFSRVEPGRAVKKARCVQLSEPNPKGRRAPQTTQYQSPSGLTLSHEPGCFSRQRLDPGARVLLETMTEWPKVRQLIDLGCGNGVLALSYLQQHPDAEAILVDESAQAVTSARHSAVLNGLEHKVSLHHNNGLTGLALGNCPLVLCNPPFHQANTLTEDIAESLFREARTVLAGDGECWIVANRHLPYFRSLKTLFRQVDLRSAHPKFIVYRCAN